MKNRAGSGRPPKFEEACRPVTMTLPVRILQRLEALDSDRARAVVKCVEAVGQSAWGGEERVELVRVADQTALIVVGPCPSLRGVPWLEMIEIAPCRFLLSVPTGTAIETLEVTLLDLIEPLPPAEEADRVLLTQLRGHLSRLRRSEGVVKREVLVVDMSKA